MATGRSIAATSVSDLAGNALSAPISFNFFFLNADANHDGVVDTLDFNTLAANFGATGRTFSQADFNYDGVVDTLDFNALAGNFGKSLPTEASFSFSATPIGSSVSEPQPRDASARLIDLLADSQ